MFSNRTILKWIPHHSTEYYTASKSRHASLSECFKRHWYTHEHSSTSHNNQKKAIQGGWISQKKMEYRDNVCIFNITPPFKGNTDTGHSVNEAWRHDATWNARHKTINTVWFHSYEVLRRVKIIETEKRMVVPTGWNRGWRTTVDKEFQFYKMKRALWMDGDDGGNMNIPNHLTVHLKRVRMVTLCYVYFITT